MTLGVHKEKGLALVAVLWITGALGLLITGLTLSVRHETRSVAVQRQMVLHQGILDGAVLLALQQIHGDKNTPLDREFEIPVEYAGQQLSVSVQPLNGLVDLNQASPALLALLFQHGAGLSAEESSKLAQDVVQYRETPASGARKIGLDAPEDLLNVQGFSYDVYASIEKLVTCELTGGSGKINPMAAPPAVLKILTDGDERRAQDLVERRRSDPLGMDLSLLNQAFIDKGAATFFRLVARREEPRSILRAWVIFWGKDQRQSLPWKVISKQSLSHNAGTSLR